MKISELYNELMSQDIDCKLSNDVLVIYSEDISYEISNNIGYWKVRVVDSLVNDQRIKRGKAFVKENKLIDCWNKFADILSSDKLPAILRRQRNLKHKYNDPSIFITSNIDGRMKKYLVRKHEADRLRSLGYKVVFEQANVKYPEYKVKGRANKKAMAMVYKDKGKLKVKV